jgi:hypothetical protein
MSNTQTLIELARSFPIREGITHWEGCETHHRECLLRKLADATEAWMLAAESYRRERLKPAQDSAAQSNDRGENLLLRSLNEINANRDENLLLRAFNALNAASAVAELPPICEEVVAELGHRLAHRT